MKFRTTGDCLMDEEYTGCASLGPTGQPYWPSPMFCHSYKPYKCYQDSLPPSSCPYPSQFFLYTQPSTNVWFTFTHQSNTGTDSKVTLGKLLRETHTHSSWVLMTHRLHRVDPSTAQDKADSVDKETDGQKVTGPQWGRKRESGSWC